MSKKSSAEAEARLGEIVSSLKEHGHRLTPQRMAILRALLANRQHPTAEQVYEQVKADFPMMSLATVYKTIHLLRDIGQVLELGFSDEGKRFDAFEPHAHPHLICTRCRSIQDSELESLDKLCGQLARRTGYQIVSCRLDFFGICPKCQAG